MEFPNELLYTKDYSWVKIERRVAFLGVVEPAAKLVKEFVFISLPREGRSIKKGDTYVSLEAMKWSGHLSSPFSGEILKVNNSLYDNPSSINKNPYSSWIVKISIKNPEEKGELMGPREARKWFQEKHGGD